MIERLSDDNLNESLKIVGDYLQGCPPEAFQHLERLYKTAITTESTQFVAGVLRRIDDEVEWSHGKGIRHGKICGFYSRKVEVLFPSGTKTGIARYRIRDHHRTNKHQG